MLNSNSLLKVAFASFLLVITILSCTQQPKKTDTATAKEQTKPITVQMAKMTVGGMVCSACQSNVKKAINSLTGVTRVEVNLENKTAFFSYDPLKVKPEQIQKAVNDKGYTANKPQVVKQ